MSRVGKLPVQIPKAVTVKVNNNSVVVTGPKGTESINFDKAVKLDIKDNFLYVSPADDSRFAAAMHGTARSLIYGLVVGVETPYIKDLEIHGVGMKAQLVGTKLRLYLGYSHVIDFNIPDGITITVSDNTKIKVEGINKQKVGQVAGEIKHKRPVEVYKGKGVRITGQFVRRKEGKKSAK